MEYTSKQRIQKAMKLEQPDRIPLMCQFSVGFMMMQLKPDPVLFWYDEKTFADGLIELRERFHFDGILVSLHGHSARWKDGLLCCEKISESTVRLIYADRIETHSWEDLPVVVFNRPFYNRSIEDIKPECDIPNEINYIPVSGNLYFSIDKERAYTIFDYIYSKVGTHCSIHGEITSPFDYFLDFFGYENGLMALITEPEKSKQVLAKFAKGVKQIAVEMCGKPIDAIKISSPFAGRGFISSEFYEEFVLPYEQDIISAIRSCGKEVYIHTCGSIGDRLEQMQASGASGLECLDPVPVGDVDLENAFSRIGNTMFIKGNIDSVNTLLYGSEEKLITDVRKIIETGMFCGKGLVLSTACSIAPLVSEERILLLADLVAQYGIYSNHKIS